MISFDLKLLRVSREEADVSDQRPGYGAGDGRFEILRQSTAAAEPCESSFDHPSAWQNFEPLRGVGTSDYFECPFTNTLQRLAQLLASIAAIGEDKAQPWVERADRSEHTRGTIAILNVGLVHDQPDQIALRVGDDVAFCGP